jgi:arsenate reductase
MDLPTVLFVCADNAAASLMAEAYLGAVGSDRARPFSAGLTPAARPDPRALRALAAAGLPTDGLAPKPLEVFALPEAPHPDVLVALTPELIGRSEPHWRRPPRRLTWFLPAPPAGAGTAAYTVTLGEIMRRIDRALVDGLFGRRLVLALAG